MLRPPRSLRWLTALALGVPLAMSAPANGATGAQPAAPADGAQPAADGAQPVADTRDEPAARAWTLEDLLAHATAHHPALRAAAASAEAAAHRTDAAWRLPRPVLSAMVAPSPIETRLGPQTHRVGLAQRVPWPARITAGHDAAAARADQAHARAAADAIAQRTRVRTWYWRAWLPARLAEATRAQAAVVRALETTVKAHVETGTAPLSALSQLALLHARLDTAAREYDAQAAAAQAQLAAHAGLPAWRGTLVLTAAAPAALERGAPSARAASQGAPHARVAVHQAAQAAEKARADAANAAHVPDVTLGVQWVGIGSAPGATTADAGRDAWLLTAAVPLPVWWHADHGQTAAHRASARAAALRGQAAADAVAAQRAAARVTHARHFDTWTTVQTTLGPQAAATTAATLADYAASKAPIADVLAAVQTELDVVRQGLRARAACGIARATWLDATQSADDHGRAHTHDQAPETP